MVSKFYSDHTICTALEQDFSPGHLQRGCFFPLISFVLCCSLCFDPEVVSLSLRVSWHCNLFTSDRGLFCKWEAGFVENSLSVEWEKEKHLNQLRGAGKHCCSGFLCHQSEPCQIPVLWNVMSTCKLLATVPVIVSLLCYEILKYQYC